LIIATKYFYKKSTNFQTEEGGLAVTFWIRIWEVISSNLGSDIPYPDAFLGFPQSLKANVRVAYGIGHEHFLSNPLQIIGHLL
jgi:hypothetical protein